MAGWLVTGSGSRSTRCGIRGSRARRRIRRCDLGCFFRGFLENFFDIIEIETGCCTIRFFGGDGNTFGSDDPYHAIAFWAGKFLANRFGLRDLQAGRTCFTKNGKWFHTIDVIDSNSVATKIRCWGIDPAKDIIYLNKPYVLKNPNYNEAWGFSTYGRVDKKWMMIG